MQGTLPGVQIVGPSLTTRTNTERAEPARGAWCALRAGSDDRSATGSADLEGDVALCGVHVGGGVDSRAATEHVGSSAAGEGVVATAAAEKVDPGAPDEGVVAAAAEQQVGARRTPSVSAAAPPTLTVIGRSLLAPNWSVTVSVTTAVPVAPATGTMVRLRSDPAGPVGPPIVMPDIGTRTGFEVLALTFSVVGCVRASESPMRKVPDRPLLGTLPPIFAVATGAVLASTWMVTCAGSEVRLSAAMSGS